MRPGFKNSRRALAQDNNEKQLMAREILRFAQNDNGRLRG